MSQVKDESAIRRFSIGRITALLSILVLLSAALTIRAELAESQSQIYLFKPLTMLLIITIVGLAVDPPTRRYKRLIIAGLAFSLVGDILFMLPQDLFVPGVFAFLIAQAIYSFAFIQVGGFYKSIWGALPFVFYASIIFYFLAPDLGDMNVPVLLYIVVIMFMIWQALGQYVQTRETRALFALIGAIFFVFSDTALAVNRFSSPIDLDRLIVLGTYFFAQWLIALSAGTKHP